MSLRVDKIRKKKCRYNQSPYFKPKGVSLNSTGLSSNLCLSNNLGQSEYIGDDCNWKGQRLSFSFFNTPCEKLAKALLGKIMGRKMANGVILKGRIVETESYLGGEDKASISYGGKMTEKSKPMYMKPGTTFVYMTYGMYNLINISSYGDGAAVLIRALDPLEGLDVMAVNRSEFQPNKNKTKRNIKEIPSHQLCNGPAKLCISLDITKEKCNMQDLSDWNEMWIEPGEDVPVEMIVNSRRIGIDSAGAEWANKLLRFYILNNKSVSKRDKVQERSLQSGDSHHSLL